MTNTHTMERAVLLATDEINALQQQLSCYNFGIDRDDEAGTLQVTSEVDGRVMFRAINKTGTDFWITVWEKGLIERR